jgi:protein TonB
MKISFMALCVLLSVVIQSESFEKRAISAVRRLPASSLDTKLPNRSFVAWLNELVGQESGFVWQLAECGAGGGGENGYDMPACAEATALLPNGDSVVVGISVGTFKKGLVGEPSFIGAVIKSGERLYRVRKLSDLPALLRSPKNLSLILPDLQPGPTQALMRLPTADQLQAALTPGDNSSAPGFSTPDDDKAAPLPPKPRALKTSEEFVEAIVITKVKPNYPAAARNLNASGRVEVKVVISETGRVIEAVAISGHTALRSAAVDAARQWVYKPATRDGVPVKTDSIVPFTFSPGVQ